MRKHQAVFSRSLWRGFTKAEWVALVAVLSLAVAVLVPMLFPASRQASQAGNLARCKENLRQMGVALAVYGRDNDGAFPVSPVVDGPHKELVQALAPRYLSDGQIFYCPGESQPEWMYSVQHLKDGNIGYFYYGASAASTNEDLSRFLLTGVTWPRSLNTHLEPKTWVMSDRWFSGTPTPHAEYRKGVNYLMLDGGVDFVSESPRQAFH